VSTQEAAQAGTQSPSTFRFGHCGLTVSNIESAIALYSVVLQADPPEVWVGERKKYLDEEVGYQDVTLKVAAFDLPNGYFELLEYANPKGAVNDAETNNVGHVHFCFDVDDIQAEYDRLVSAGLGLEFRSSGPVVVPDDDPDWAGYKCLYFRTPDGHTIELAESHE
jgi:catechol 2,3-dioxygenase-like lactoylglutathione lyase family enzyme